MSKKVPFFFCRYQMLVDEEPLDENAQFQAISELQGRLVAHRRRGSDNEVRDTKLMRPRSLEVDGHRVLTWSVGRDLQQRVAPTYDPKRDELEWTFIKAASVCYSDFAAVPSLGVLAVDDRQGDNHLGGRAAIGRFRSVFSMIDGGAINVDLTTSPQDAHRALDSWSLTEFSFVARPFNPHPPGDLSKALSESFTKDGIFRYRAVAEPLPGKTMDPAKDGHIAAAVELSDAGYGQYGFKGYTIEGHEGQIKRPKFDLDRQKNVQRQAEPRELRVVVNTEDASDHALFERVARALIGFYGT